MTEFVILKKDIEEIIRYNESEKELKILISKIQNIKLDGSTMVIKIEASKG